MSFSAKFVSKGVIEIEQGLDEAELESRVTYNLRCENPSVDITVDASKRPVIQVPVDYDGVYLVTKRVTNPATGVVNSHITSTVQAAEKPKKKAKKKKAKATT